MAFIYFNNILFLYMNNICELHHNFLHYLFLTYFTQTISGSIKKYKINLFLSSN